MQILLFIWCVWESKIFKVFSLKVISVRVVYGNQSDAS